MKWIKVVAVVAALGMAAGGYAIVQTLHGHRMNGSDAAEMAAHLSAVYPKFAAFDVNKDGQLDATEKAALGKAIADGSLAFPAPVPPKEAFGSEELRLDHFAEMYGRFAVYDANRDGALDANEQAALQMAVETGAVRFPGGGHHAHDLGKLLHSR